MRNVIPLPRSESLARPLRAAIYGRASKDRLKRERSIRDQFAVAEDECHENGWHIVDYYKDADRSASRRATKVREDFERMVADIKAGHIDVVVYAERSRVSRNMSVSIELRDTCEEHGILLCYDGRVYDLRKAADFREFTRDALQSEEEAESIAHRNLRTARLHAKRGNPTATPPFGYKREYDPDTGELIGQVPNPDEVPTLVKMFELAEQRKSLRSLIELMKPFRPGIAEPGVRVILRNRAYIGIRVHHDEEHKANWPALVDEARFWSVQAILDEPERRTTRTSGIQHLQTGIALCGVCREEGMYKRARMTARLPSEKYKRGGLYRCRVNHLSVMEDTLDAFVEEALLVWLGSPKAAAAFQRTDSAGDIERERVRLAAIRSQLDEAREAASDFDPETGAPRLSALSLASLEQRVLPLIADAEARIRSLLGDGDPLLDRLMTTASASELDVFWSQELTLEQKRHVLRRSLRVQVNRAPSQSRWHPIEMRVVLIFRGESGFDDWPLEDQ